jgi:hypothetical protein
MPPPAEFRAKLRWEPDGEGYHLYAGKKLMGCVAQIRIGHQKDEKWSHNGSGCWSRDYPDLAAAQSALVAAVMEMQGE